MISLPSSIGSRPYVDSNATLADTISDNWSKRLFDILFASLITALVLSWLIPLVGLAIRLSSPGPILFIQLRNGRNGKRFHCFKFRTMAHHAGAEFRQAAKDDDRVTPLGRFLRKTNLDEMPQFLNVLLGDMSVVGPRPHPIQLDAQFSRLIPGFMDRYAIKPGITGVAQTRGLRGETGQQEMVHRVRLDKWYLQKWSFALDIKICWWTVANMFKGDHKAW